MKRGIDVFKRRKKGASASGDATKMSIKNNITTPAIEDTRENSITTKDEGGGTSKSFTFDTADADFSSCTSPFTEDKSCSSSTRKSKKRSPKPDKYCSRQPVDAPGWVGEDEPSITCSESQPYLSSPPRVFTNYDEEPQWTLSESPTTYHQKNSFSESSAYFMPLLDGMKQTSDSYSTKSMTVSSQGSKSRKTIKTIEPPRKQISSLPFRASAKRNSSSDVLFDNEDFYDISPKSSGSMPPPDFLPRKEVRDAIKYHHRLGKALSKLALIKEVNQVHESHHFEFQDQHSKHRSSAYSVTSTTSTSSSTIDSSVDFTNYVGRLGATSNSKGIKMKKYSRSASVQHRGNHSITAESEGIVFVENGQQKEALSEKWMVNFDGGSDGNESDFSSFSASSSVAVFNPKARDATAMRSRRRKVPPNVLSTSICDRSSEDTPSSSVGSSRSNGSKLEQHLAFLEKHMKNVGVEHDNSTAPSATLQNSSISSATFSQSGELRSMECPDDFSVSHKSLDDFFFPETDDLKSPSESMRAFHTKDDEVWQDTISPFVIKFPSPCKSRMPNLTPRSLSSPPNTPTVILKIHPKARVQTRTMQKSGFVSDEGNFQSISSEACGIGDDCQKDSSVARCQTNEWDADDTCEDDNSSSILFEIEERYDEDQIDRERNQVDSRHIQPQREEQTSSLDGERLLTGMERIKNETAAMMNDFQEKMRADIKETMEKEMAKQCSVFQQAVSGIAANKENIASNNIRHCSLETTQVDTEHEIHASSFAGDTNKQTFQTPKFSPSFQQRRSQFVSPSSTTKSPAFVKASPQTPKAESSTDQNALLKELENSLRSMEASILNKISSQMEKEASQQREAMEEIIESKVTQAMAGASLEVQLAVHEVKQASERALKTPPRRSIPSHNSSPGRGFVSPRRYPTPIKTLVSSPISAERISKENREKTIEDSFAETMRVIDDFVVDCDNIVDDFDKIAFRMQDVDPDTIS